MKYMTFNSSCSYAGLANMLAQYGVDASDRSIALAMKLPYLFSYQDGAYLSGPMLQSAQWFNLYLNPIGYRLVETTISVSEIADYLKAQKTAMLGIETGINGKHAVVYIETKGNQLVFLNNKWESEESPDEIRLTADELKKRVDPRITVATLQKSAPKKISLVDKLQESIPILQANLSEIMELCQNEVTVESLRLKLNTLFRPLFLDGITMLSLIGEVELSKSLTVLQSELLSALRQDPRQRISLQDYISTAKLQESAEKYIGLIRIVTMSESGF